MNAIDRYHQEVLNRIQAVVPTQRDVLERAATLVARALIDGHFLYAFGTGHSHLLAEEIFYRAGGLARAAAILDPPLMLHEGAAAGSACEQRTGYAAEVLSRYPIRPGDVLVIASNSGRNAVPIEMAMAARQHGIATIAVTSLAHSQAFPSRHPSGQRLFEVADLVLDNQSAIGDATTECPGLPRRIGPTSTLTGAFLLNLLVVRAIELAVEQGCLPEIYASSNADVPGWNDSLVAAYRHRVRHL